MFFVLSKTLDLVAVPSNITIVICLAGALLSFTRYRRAGVRIMLAGVLLLALLSYSPAGRIILLSLEQRFPAWTPRGEEPDGVVVLGGAFNASVSYGRGVFELGPAADRLIAVARLAREYPNMRILLSGGIASLFPLGEPEAELAARLLQSFGVPRSRLLLEDKSRNTAENALYGKALVNPQPNERWLLVTSALHMPRAVGAFRRVQFPVEPHPVDWITGGPHDARAVYFVASNGLTAVDIGVHEWIGLLVYWLSGRTSEIFPAP